MRATVQESIDWEDAYENADTYLSRADALYDTHHWTPLMEAVEVGELPLVQALLRAGAEKDFATPEGMTALSLARELGQEKIVRFLEQN